MSFKNTFFLLFSLLFLATACEKKPIDLPIVPDPAYSVNVVAVPEFWPREKKDWSKDQEIKEVQQRAWKQYGTPDYFRYVYTTDRRIVREIELTEGFPLAGKKDKDTIEWVYLNDEIALEFKGPKVIEHELEDDLKYVCLYGDPNVMRDHTTRDGTIQQHFIYYNHGKRFVFQDHELMETHSMTALPGAERIRE